MGSLLLPVTADVNEYFEEEALNRANYKPTCWIQYINNIFVVQPHEQKS
jgi:hypothetical protein